MPGGIEVAGVHLTHDPVTASEMLAYIAAGICLGTISGLIPGLHANNFALLLAAAAPALPGPPASVGFAMLAAGVTHTFLDVVPALALGVPDADMAATALPGHKLVIDGRGREALRLSAAGSGLAVVFAAPLAVPLTAAMTEIYPFIEPRVPLLLAGLAVFLIATEPTRTARLGGAGVFCAAGGLGVLVLDHPAGGVLGVGGMLTPLFAGLFGAPVLLDAISGGGIPKQEHGGLAVRPTKLAVTAAAGALAGAIVGYLPGVSSAIATIVVLTAVPAAGGSRGFVVASSGVNTANMIFALFALVALGSPRTGVLVAIDEAGVPLNLPGLLASVLIAAAVSFALVVILGDRYLEIVRGIDYAALSGGILVVLLGIVVAFAGGIGLVAFAVSALIGLVPPRVGARRVHAMGVLIVPIMLG